MDKLQILLVEDDTRLAALVSEYLGQHEFQVQLESRGDTAVKRFCPDTTDLVILDLTLPGLDGLEVCRDFRSRYRRGVESRKSTRKVEESWQPGILDIRYVSPAHV